MNEEEAEIMGRLEQTLSDVSTEDVSLNNSDPFDLTKELSKGIEKELLDNYPCCNKALRVFREDKSKLLFILVIEDEDDKGDTIRFFTKQNQNPKPIIIDQEIRKKSIGLNRILKGKQDYTEREVINLSKSLSEKLLHGVNGVLPETPGEEYWVWIYCEIDNINHIWEWIYTGNGEQFFWGDRFFIVRIPENCNFENLNFQFNKATILFERSSSPAYETCAKEEILRTILRNMADCHVTPIDDPQDLKNLEIFKFIHVGASRKTFENGEEWIKAFHRRLLQIKPYFLFFTMFADSPSSKHGCLSKSINLQPHTTLIDSYFNIPKEFASPFVKCFYKILNESLKNSNEANIVEILAKTRKKFEKLGNKETLGYNPFWRLAYVVTGNPYIKLKTKLTYV